MEDYLAVFGPDAAEKETTVGKVASDMMQDQLKASVCAAMKAIMLEKPEHPIRFLAEHLRSHNKKTLTEAKHVDVGGVSVNLEALNRFRRGCLKIELEEMPIEGLLAPSAVEIQQAIDRALARTNGAVVHLVIQRSLKDDYIFLRGEMFKGDYTVNCYRHRPEDSEEDQAPRRPLPAVDEDGRNAVQDSICKAMKGKTSFKVTPMHQVISGLSCSLELQVHYVDSVSSVLPLTAYDTVNSMSKLDDDGDMDPVVVVTTRNEDALRSLLTAVVAVQMPQKEIMDLRSAAELDVEQKEETLHQEASKANHAYWEEVIARRQERDEERAQLDERRRVKLAQEAAAAAAAAVADAMNNTSSAFSLGGTPPVTSLSAPPQLTPKPPRPPISDQRKKALSRRQKRHQDEDISFLQVMTIQRNKAATKIQSVARGMFSRRRVNAKQFLEDTQGLYARTMTMKSERYETGGKDFYTGPALIRRVLYQLNKLEPELFTTRPPPPPFPPKRVTYWAPQRVPISTQYDDDVSSEEEVWEEHEVELPPRPRTTRRRTFNTQIRLSECSTLVGNKTQSFISSNLRNSRGQTNLQHRTYDAITQWATQLLHVAHLEMMHRELLPRIPFSRWISEHMWELRTYVSYPHFFAQTVAPKGAPTPMAYGPLSPSHDRVLYGSEFPAELPWGVKSAEIPPIHSSEVAASHWFAWAPQSRVYCAVDGMDLRSWRSIAMVLSTMLDHDHVGWISVQGDPMVYVKDKAYVSVPRPPKQRIPNIKTGIALTAELKTAGEPKSPLTSPTSSSAASSGRRQSAALAKSWYGVTWTEMERRLKAELVNRIEGNEGNHSYLTAFGVYSPYFADLIDAPMVTEGKVCLWPKPERRQSTATNASDATPSISGSVGEGKSGGRNNSLSGEARRERSMRRLRSMTGPARSSSTSGSHASALRNQSMKDFEFSPEDNRRMSRSKSMKKEAGEEPIGSSSTEAAPVVIPEPEPEKPPIDLLVNTPSHIAEQEVFSQYKKGRSGMYLRYPMLDVCGQAWIHALDRYIATIYAQLSAKPWENACTVIAVSHKKEMFYVVVATLVSYLAASTEDGDFLEAEREKRERERQPPEPSPEPSVAESSQSHGLIYSGSFAKVDSSGEDSDDSDAETETAGFTFRDGEGEEAVKRVETPKPREIMACLEGLRLSCPAVDLEMAMEEVDIVLDLCKCKFLKDSIEESITKAEANRAKPEVARQHTLEAVRSLERYGWLVLVAAFLRLQMAYVKQHSDMPSFGNWCERLAKGGLEWIEDIDPWAEYPEYSPDPFHREYSNIEHRWRNYNRYITLAL